MTPNEIADECLTLSRLEACWYADVGKRTGERCCEAMRNAAATIRELEAGRAKWEDDDGLDGSVVHAVREVLNRANVPTMAFIDDHVALLVHQRDAAEAKLKIATEALDWVEQCYGHEMSEEMGAHISQALARIKEV